jgi:sirohydrochlorin cobaltochelatase
VTRDITAALSRWLAAGFLQIGQVRITPVEAGFELRHIEDTDRTDLEEFRDPEAARHLSVYADSGAFRPLRTAPNLRHGWSLRLADLGALRKALDHFYPSMLGVLLSHEVGELRVQQLRETLNRQTGMYAITRKLTDEQANEMVGGFCRSDGGCLKTILWQIADGVPVTTLPASKFDPAANQVGGSEPAIAMLCHEICNLLVAKARTVVKGGTATAE